jgi:hypothetical protein
MMWDNDEKRRTGTVFRASSGRLFPVAEPGNMNVSAFEPLHSFKYDYNLGSQIKFVRHSSGTWYLLAFTSRDNPDESAPSYIDVHQLDQDTLVPTRPLSSWLIDLPPSHTSFSSSGTHYVDRFGMLQVYSSFRWAEDQGDPFGFESRVDECARAW